MGQINLHSDAEFEATNQNGEKTTITLKGGRNIPVSKITDLGNGLCDITLSSGSTVHNVDLDKVGRKVGRIDTEQLEEKVTPPTPPKYPFQRFEEKDRPPII